MLKFLYNLRGYLKTIVTITMFFVSAVLIVYMLPRAQQFNLEYNLGNPWKYDNLTANFSFSVYKTEQVIQKERDSVRKNLPAYFSFDAYVFSENLQMFKNDFNKRWVSYSLRKFKIDDEKNYNEGEDYLHLRKLQVHYHDFIFNELERAYLKGIVRVPSESEIKLNRETATIKLLRGNVAEEIPFNTLYTIKTAYQHVSGQLLREIEKEKKPAIKSYFDFFSELDINKYLIENVLFNLEKTEMDRTESEKSISLTEGKIQQGELIIAQGVIVTNELFQILESYKRDFADHFGKVNSFSAWLGRILLVSLSLLVIYLFLYNFRREILNTLPKTGFILFMLVSMLFIAHTAYSIENVSFYIVPFAILPIILRTFYDERVALFIHVITILLAAFYAINRFEFVLMNILSGMVAIFSLTNLYHRSRFFLSAIFVVIAYSVTYFGLSVVNDGSFSTIMWSQFRDFAMNGVLILVSFLLIYIFEKTFGFLSDTTLMELSDTNQPLLRKLAEFAPATFQHSMQVANLSEEAVRHIGGNPMLVRTGALYHDIGKMIDPSYFTENQTGGVDPHSDKDLRESAKIIIGHVEKGMELAKKYNLPEPIASFIVTHHGTSTAKYFLKTFQNQNPNSEVNKEEFQYPGPKPMSKENAVLMMADSVEAASRSLGNYSDESIDELVERIINSQIDEGQFEDADISFKDIRKVKEVFKARLKTIYHPRIVYPK